MDWGIKLFMFKYNSILILIIYGLIYLADLILNIGIFSNNWIVKLFGTLCGYFVNYLIIKEHVFNYYFDYQNILKYLTILLFQYTLFV